MIESLKEKEIEQIGCDFNFSAVQTKEGELMMFGDNSLMQLGAPLEKFSQRDTPGDVCEWLGEEKLIFLHFSLNNNTVTAKVKKNSSSNNNFFLCHWGNGSTLKFLENQEILEKEIIHFSFCNDSLILCFEDHEKSKKLIKSIEIGIEYSKRSDLLGDFKQISFNIVKKVVSFCDSYVKKFYLLFFLLLITILFVDFHKSLQN